MKNRNKIIFICIITLAIFISILILCKKFLKVEFYNFWQTKNTSEYYKIMFQNIKNNSSLLDIGVGPGRNLVYNKDAILAKNISIHGIDIDPEYNKYCKKTISENKLDSIVKIELKDLFHIQTKAKYDYAIFGQSFPVIPRKIMTNMLQHALKLIKDNGRIIFIHQLDDQNKMDHLFYKIKPILKHIPFVWVDSGIATSKKDFEKWLEYNGLNYEKKIIHSDQVFDLKLNIYMYICQRKLS